MRGEPDEMDLQLAQATVPAQQAKALLACRVIAEIASRPNESMRVPDLAKRSGLTEGALQALLTSAIFRELIEDAARSTCATMMTRVLSRMDEVIRDEDVTPKLVFEAGRTLATLYRALSTGEQGQRDLDALAMAEKEIERQAALTRTRRSELTVEVLDADSASE